MFYSFFRTKLNMMTLYYRFIDYIHLLELFKTIFPFIILLIIITDLFRSIIATNKIK